MPDGADRDFWPLPGERGRGPRQRCHPGSTAAASPGPISTYALLASAAIACSGPSQLGPNAGLSACTGSGSGSCVRSPFPRLLVSDADSDALVGEDQQFDRVGGVVGQRCCAKAGGDEGGSALSVESVFGCEERGGDLIDLSGDQRAEFVLPRSVADASGFEYACELDRTASDEFVAGLFAGDAPIVVPSDEFEDGEDGWGASGFECCCEIGDQLVVIAEACEEIVARKRDVCAGVHAGCFGGSADSAQIHLDLHPGCRTKDDSVVVVMHDADQAFLDVAGDVTAALDDVPLPTALFDQEGKIRWQNKVSLSVRGRRVGLDFAEVLASEHKEEARSVFNRVLAGEGTEELVVRALNAAGEYMALQARWTAVPLRDGTTVVVVFSRGDMAEEAPPATAEHIPQLTQRQSDVLRLLADGKSTDEIASELSLNRTTVRNYIANLLAALDVHSRLQAVVAAREAGLLDS